VDADYETEDVTYIVPGLASDQGERAVSMRLLSNPSVEAVIVDLETKGVTVHGRKLDAVALRTAIESAGYQAA
jgi:Heavy-metal-associated domain